MARKPQDIFPHDCPLPRSQLLNGLQYTGRMTVREGADTWYPTWAADGNLYTPFADGVVKGQRSNCNRHESMTFEPGIESNPRSGHGFVSTCGSAVLSGDDPFDLRIETREPLLFHTPRFHGQYPCCSFHHRGIWYYATYYVHRWLTPSGKRTTYELGPVPGFRISRDGGATWEPLTRDDRNPLFPERGRVVGGKTPIRFGAPHLVDHGRENEHAPDGKLYVIGHGSSDPEGVSNWLVGDELFVARVDPSPETINEPAAWEFLAGSHHGNPQWTHDFSKMEPIVRWPGCCGIVNATWVPRLQRYLMFVSTGPEDGGEDHYNTWIAEAPTLAGPWSLVDWWPEFGSRGYFVCMPSKFLKPDSDRAIVFWSANWEMPASAWSTRRPYENPPGSRYALCIGEFRFDRLDIDTKANR
jgi:hypothetical protein